MRSKEVLKILKITRPTLTSYVKNGKIRAVLQPNNFYDYNEDDVLKLAGLSTSRKAVIYARVSTQKQKNDLQNQIETIRQYANANGYVIDNVFSDIASGLNYDRGSFIDMFNKIINREIKIVFVSNKDRLTRVSFGMWRELFAKFNCELKTINEDDMTTSENEEKEIFSDIISLLHCFAMRMYSSRRKKKITLVKEDLENEIGL